MYIYHAIAVPGIPYQVAVVAFTSVGRGVENHVHMFFSEEQDPEKFPENVMYERIGTIISVSWDPLTLFEARGFPIYTVMLIPLPLAGTRVNRQSNDNGIISVTINKTNILIEGVDPDVEYSLTVSVKTRSGEMVTKGS